jgi:hypothetical protein
MSRGLGEMQRMLLRRMAAFEMRQAELATQQQERPDPPHGWSVAGLFRALARDELHERAVEPQRRRHEAEQQAWRDLTDRVLAGDEDAKARFNLRIMGAQMAGLPLPDAATFTPVVPTACRDHFNAARIMRGLVSRGFVYHRSHLALVPGFRSEAWVLTAEGFVAARRLGDVVLSEIVDLDQLQARWCEAARLPFHLATGCYPDEITP